MKKPSFEEAERCILYRKNSKSGKGTSLKEHKFCRKMFKKYPEWYKKTEERVFNETAPFGSMAKYQK